MKEHWSFPASTLPGLLILMLLFGVLPRAAQAITISFAEPVSETGDVTVSLAGSGVGGCPPAPCVLQVAQGRESGSVDFLIPAGTFPIPGMGGVATAFLLENVMPRGPISDRVTLQLFGGPPGSDQITVSFLSDSAATPLGDAHPLEADLSVVESSSNLTREGFFELKFFVVPEDIPVPTPFSLPAGTSILVRSDVEETPEIVEPSTLSVLAVGIVGLLGYGWRRAMKAGA